MIEISRGVLAALALIGAGVLQGCDAGEPPALSGGIPASTGDRASPDGAGISELPGEGASGGGEVAPPLEATLDTPAPIAAGSPDGGASQSADAGDAGPAPNNDCCTASAGSGCADATVAACVCAGDPFCCSTEYDESCVTSAISRCGLDCDDRAPTSDCCTTSDVPGCTLPEVEACICDIDPACCVLRFDQNCINLGISQCGAVCGAADGGT